MEILEKNTPLVKGACQSVEKLKNGVWGDSPTKGIRVTPHGVGRC